MNGFVMWSQTWNVHDRVMVLPTPPGVVLRVSEPAPVPSLGGLVFPEAVPAVDRPSLCGFERDLALRTAVGACCLEEFLGPVPVVSVSAVCHFFHLLVLTVSNKTPSTLELDGRNSS